MGNLCYSFLSRCNNKTLTFTTRIKVGWILQVHSKSISKSLVRSHSLCSHLAIITRIHSSYLATLQHRIVKSHFLYPTLLSPLSDSLVRGSHNVIYSPPPPSAIHGCHRTKVPRLAATPILPSSLSAASFLVCSMAWISSIVRRQPSQSSAAKLLPSRDRP